MHKDKLQQKINKNLINKPSVRFKGKSGIKIKKKTKRINNKLLKK